MKMDLNYRASSLPGLYHCYEYLSDRVEAGSGKANEKAISNGSLQHAYLSALINNDTDTLKASPLSSRDAQLVEQSYLRVNAFVREYAPHATIESEVSIKAFDGRGIADIVAYDPLNQTLVIIDYKSHETLKNFAPQVKWYARSYLLQHERVAKHIYVGILFGDTNKFMMEQLTQDELLQDVSQIMQTIKDNKAKQLKCASSWCETCKHRGTCKTSADSVIALNVALKDSNTLTNAQLADMLNLCTENEKMANGFRCVGRDKAANGERLVDSTKTFEYVLQEVTSQTIDVRKMFAFIKSLRDKTKLNALLAILTVSKSDAEKLLLECKIGNTPKERGIILKEMYGEATTHTRLKRISLE